MSVCGSESYPVKTKFCELKSRKQWRASSLHSETFLIWLIRHSYLLRSEWAFSAQGFIGQQQLLDSAGITILSASYESHDAIGTKRRQQRGAVDLLSAVSPW
ncbi:hypothetical protein KOW79_011302 [Hemibagrus wyckioides]|uniref:Uncharacterized protein n=1 Tax=Hemibagrus wyckioides TaxID=337641 RepID=A0A9D3NK09_9TELE|nr:hypothetical protein KOW79_011302 [Hemibagrus wyckioides]